MTSVHTAHLTSRGCRAARRNGCCTGDVTGFPTDAAILDFPSSSGVSSTGCSGSTGAVTLLLIDAVTSLDVPAPAYSKSSAVFAFRLRACSQWDVQTLCLSNAHPNSPTLSAHTRAVKTHPLHVHYPSKSSQQQRIKHLPKSCQHSPIARTLLPLPHTPTPSHTLSLRP